ncbi:sigma-70 family RNA polymerase sigma factor [Petroclostridium sp. X23]|uniref:sigma-70 family RNA polymerase sigma factor n=1 Tax=Petroclostridium sp. X23 TaxID=3045146 RepID=UPI0024AE4B33|nr:sigma-70 family RNA polymerase sigma factor [Petroclostridium sp. X23]WHH60412.1 sigma-70 family RNA polymerase sigma factor [Petroclostridium sp. X23]
MNTQNVSNEALIENADRGEKYAIEQLYKNNLGMINRICNWIAKDPQESEDLLQESYIALVKAVKHYNPARNIKFISYYTTALKRHLWRYVKVTRLNADSLDEDLPDRDNLTLVDTLEDESLMAHEEAAALEELKEAIEEALEKLPSREEQIIRNYYYAGDATRDIAEAFKISTERVHQIRRAGLSRLRMKGKLQKLWEEYAGPCIESTAFASGLNNFKYTFTSSTERAAMTLMEIEEEVNKIIERLGSNTPPHKNGRG